MCGKTLIVRLTVKSVMHRLTDEKMDIYHTACLTMTLSQLQLEVGTQTLRQYIEPVLTATRP